MSEIRLKRSDSYAVVTSPVSHTYRMTSPHLSTVRRVLSLPDLTSGVVNRFDTSTRKYGGGTREYSQNRRYTSHWDRWDDYVVDRRYSYVNPKYWSYYGNEPYRPYQYRQPSSTGSLWGYYPGAYYYPRSVRTDYLDTWHYRRHREPYHAKTHYFYYQYRPWAY